MNQQHTPPPYTPPSQSYWQPPEPEVFPAARNELLFALCTCLCAVLYANCLLFGGLHLGFALALTGCILCTWVYLNSRGKRGTVYSRAILVLCLIITAGFGRSDDNFVKFVMGCFLLVGLNLSYCLIAEQNRRSPAGALSLLDAGRSIFTLGFRKIAPALQGLVDAFRSGSPTSQRFGAVLLGAAIAMPVLAIVIPLLISADAAFDGLISLLPKFDLEEILYTVGAGTGLFCLFYSRGVALIHDQEESETRSDPKRLNPLTVNTFLVAVCAVYVCYLFSQLAYFTGGFAGILPEGYSTAEYARRGFFEMAWLCCINLGIMTFSMAMIPKEPKAPLSTRLLCLFIGLMTLFFVCASFAKMGLYVSVYGLTRLRVLTMVIMVFLGITVCLVSVWLFLPKLPYMKVIVITALVIGALVLWTDVDAQVARHNVDAYLSGDLTGIDLNHLHGLGSGAVPALLELLEAEEPAVASWAQQELTQRACAFSGRESGLRSWNQIQSNAKTLLEPYLPVKQTHATR